MPQVPACLPVAVFGKPVDHLPAEQDDVAEVAVVRAMRSSLYRCVLRLEPDQRHVIIHHYGLAGADVRTCRRIASDLGLSPATVVRLERRALDHLRTWL